MSAVAVKLNSKNLSGQAQDTMSYDEIFNKRGDLYDLAMQKYPDARRNEFNALFYRNPVSPGDSIIDLPSGGAYLKNYIPASASVESWEISEGFVLREGINYVRPDRISQDINKRYDRGVCLATMHHMDDKSGFISQFSGLINKGGILHIADVADESPIKDFLDVFIDAHNDMGHKGTYISLQNDLPVPAGLKVLRKEILIVPWFFRNEIQCAEFCRLMFGLNIKTTDEEIISALKKYVGIRENREGISLNWELLYIDLLIS